MRFSPRRLGHPHNLVRAISEADDLRFAIIHAVNITQGCADGLHLVLSKTIPCAHAIYLAIGRGGNLRLYEDLHPLYDLTIDMTEKFADVLDRGRDPELERVLENLSEKALGLAVTLREIRDYHISGRRNPYQWKLSGIGRLAERLLAVAVRLLPSDNRSRYFEEFQSELSLIAIAGGNRAQLLYAVRQTMSALQLRAELLATQRRRPAR